MPKATLVDAFFTAIESQHETLPCQKMMGELRRAVLAKHTLPGPRSPFALKAIQAAVACGAPAVDMVMERSQLTLRATLSEGPQLVGVFSGQGDARVLLHLRWMLWLALGTELEYLDFHWQGLRAEWSPHGATFSSSHESCLLVVRWASSWWQNLLPASARAELQSQVTRRVALCPVPIRLDTREIREFLPEVAAEAARPVCVIGETPYFWLGARTHLTVPELAHLALAPSEAHRAVFSAYCNQGERSGQPHLYARAFAGLRAVPAMACTLFYVHDGVLLDPLIVPDLSPGLCAVICRQDLPLIRALCVAKPVGGDRNWLQEEGVELWRDCQQAVMNVKVGELRQVPVAVRQSWRELERERKTPR